MKRISVDIGGTFTDCFLVWDDRHIESKALTTHHALSEGFLNALTIAAEELDESVDTVLSEVEAVRYATTLGTNALIQRSGPRLGLITTFGYEETVLIGRSVQYGDGLPEQEQSNIPGADRPEPLIPRELIVGIRERLDYAGRVVIPASEDDIRAQVQHLVDRGARGFVVVLMHSVANPVHEDLVEEIINEEYPGAFLGAFPVVCSHDVSLKKGEYTRSMSTILDAYLHREMQHGLRDLELALRRRGSKRPMQIVHNSGGMSQLNRTHALQTIHAGPVAGLSGGEQVANERGLENLITVDMGGTSFDIGVVTGGGIRFYEFDPVIDRWRVDIPMVSMVAIGAGGGSIAKFDSTTRGITVGPDSAGSEPGPACFDMGGREPTVTDADLTLGYLNPDYYYGGRLKLSPRRATQALQSRIGKPTGLETEEAALGVRRVVDDQMAQGIFKEVALKGYDPRKFTILAYGGNGPTHACGFAEGLGIERVLVPTNSAIFSAVGAGNMDQLHIYEQSVYIAFYDALTRTVFDDLDHLNGIIDGLQDKGRRDILRQGYKEEDIQYRVEFDMRYGDQLQLTSMVLPFAHFDSKRRVMEMIKRYHTSYGQRFGEGTQMPETGIKVNKIRVISFVPLQKVSFSSNGNGNGYRRTNGANGAGGDGLKGERKCLFAKGKDFIDTPVYDYDALTVGQRIDGHALVEAPHTTFVVNPGWTLEALDGHFIELRHTAAA